MPGHAYHVTHLGQGAWVAWLGWPAITAAAVAFWLALVRRSRPWAITGCALAAPFLLYLALTPAFAWAAPASLLLLVALAWRIDSLKRGGALLLLAPAAATVLWLLLAIWRDR